MSGRLRVRLLGAFTVEGFDERELGSRKARVLLRRLALANGGAVAVDELADVLWGDQLPGRPADQVGVLVARLRRVLGADRLRRTDDGYHLVVDWLDVAEVEARTREATDALADGRLAAARAAVDAALVLARGPLLAGQDGEWADGARLRAASWLAAARRVGAAAAVAAGDHVGAVVLADAALAEDPYDEAALRVKMSASAAMGRRASALAAYADARHRLAEDLGVPPDADTERLHTALLLAGEQDGPPGPVAPGPAGAGAARPPANPEEAAWRAPTDPAGGGAFVGRAAELAVLDAAYQEAAAGGTTLLAVVGEAGIGKTALVRRWAERLAGLPAAQRPGTVCHGCCDELGRDLPLQPLADALAHQLRFAGPAPLDALGALDAAVLGSALGLGAPVLRPPPGPADIEVGDPAAGQSRLFAALLRATERLAAGAPAVVVVEDLQWAGPSTLAWLAFAQRRGERLIVVVTRRPHGPAIAGEALLALGPLDRPAVVELVGADRADELIGRTGGHPLLLTAMAAAPPPGADGDGVPAAVRAVVARELAALGPLAPTVQAAAVLGAEVDLDLLASTLHVDAVALLGELEALAATGLLSDTGRGFAFRHELVREAVAAGVASARRAWLHREAARALAERPDPPPLAVALHARRGGDDELAVAGLLAAATEATARFDVRTAERLLTEALALGPRPAVLVARARARMAGLALDAAAADAAEACRLGGGAAAFEVAGWVAYYQRRYDEAGARAEEGLARATADGDDEARAGCLALAGRARHGAGDLRGAIDLLGQVGDGPSATRAIAGVWLGQALVHGGRPGDALAATNWSLVGDGLAHHPFALLHRAFTRSMALGHLGRLGEAIATCDTFAADVERSGVVGARFADRAENTKGWLLRNAGALDEADEANHRALDHAAGSAGDGPGPGGGGADVVRAEPYWVALLDLADGALLRGDVDRAADHLERCAPLDSWGGSMAWHQRQRADLLRARLLLNRGERPAAAGLAAAVAADAADRGAERYRALAAAVAALARGPAEQAADEVGGIVDALAATARLEGWWLTWRLAERFDVPGWARRAEAWAGELVAGAGRYEAAARSRVDAVLRGRAHPV